MKNRFLKTTLALLAFVSATYSAANFKVLVFTKASGTIHLSIPTGIKCVQDLGAANGFSVDSTSDQTLFTTTNLAKYSAVIFLNTFGTVFGTAQQEAFKSYIQAGGGFVGLHSAANTEMSWTWFGGLLGNGAFRSGQLFGSYPNIRESKTHFIVQGLPDTLTLDEEYLGYANNPRSAVTVLYHSNQAPNNSNDHPSAWAHEYDGGRVAYMVWGHWTATYSDPSFKKFLLNSIIWASHKDASTGVHSFFNTYRHDSYGILKAIQEKGKDVAIAISNPGKYSLSVWNSAGRILFHGKVQGESEVQIPHALDGEHRILLVRLATEKDKPVFSGKLSLLQ